MPRRRRNRPHPREKESEREGQEVSTKPPQGNLRLPLRKRTFGRTSLTPSASPKSPEEIEENVEKTPARIHPLLPLEVTPSRPSPMLLQFPRRKRHRSPSRNLFRGRPGSLSLLPRRHRAGLFLAWSWTRFHSCLSLSDAISHRGIRRRQCSGVLAIHRCPQQRHAYTGTNSRQRGGSISRAASRTIREVFSILPQTFCRHSEMSYFA